MSAPHKHAELIKAWADGAVIEARPASGRQDWRVVRTPCWAKHWEYRVKPEPVIEKKVVRPHALVWIEPGVAPSIDVSPAPFIVPMIDLEIHYDRDSGRVTDVQLKGWQR